MDDDADEEDEEERLGVHPESEEQARTQEEWKRTTAFNTAINQSDERGTRGEYECVRRDRL